MKKSTKKLLDFYRQLPDDVAQQLLDFAEFLASRHVAHGKEALEIFSARKHYSAGDVPGAGTPWISFNSNFTTSNLINNTPPGTFYSPDAHSGTQLLKQFGTDAGSYQDLAASEGEAWEASAWAQSWAGDPNNNTGLMQIFFRDAADTNLCDPGGFNPCNQAVFDTSQSLDTWVQLTTSAIAPAGTTTVRIQVILVPDASTPANGALFWDDASLSKVAP